MTSSAAPAAAVRGVSATANADLSALAPSRLTTKM